MSTVKLTTEQVIKRRLEIEQEYKKTIREAKEKMEKELRMLQAQCPHTNSDSGEGGPLDYWFDCKDCGL